MSEESDIEALLTEDEISFGRVMECVFGIQPHETDAYLALLQLPGSTVEELAAELDRDRSTTHRTLSSLSKKDLVERERRIVDGGGYVYQYFATPVPETQRRMREAIDAWVDEVHSKIDALGTDY